MGALANRIDSFSSDDPPPRRRYRLVLDLEADTTDDLSAALTAIDFDITTRGVPEQTSGGPGSGWHFELIDEGDDVTHESWFAALTKWRASRRGIPMGGA